jgi:hypothetical protein
MKWPTHPSVTSVDFREGTYQTWGTVNPDHKYVMSADVSSGQAGDWAVIQVVCVDTRTHVARWRGKVDPEDLGQIMFDIGMMWNTAEAAPEVNGKYGSTTMKTLQRLKYPNIYLRFEEFDHAGQRTKKFGWYTSDKTKVLIISTLNRLLMTKQVNVLDSELFEEAKGFRHLSNGEMGGKPDDILMSFAIAAYIACELRKPTTIAQTPVAENSLHFQSALAVAGGDKREASKLVAEYFGLSRPRKQKSRW